MNIKTLITSYIENERLFEILDSLLEQGVITLTDLEVEFIEANPLKIIAFINHYKNNGLNFEKMEDAILNYRESKFIIDYAKKCPYANISKCEDAIINGYSEQLIYEFARDVDGANIKKLEKAVTKCKPEVIYLFAKFVKGANVENLENALIKYAKKNGNGSYFAKFAKDVKKANVERLLNAAIKNGDILNELLEFATIPNINIEKIERVILSKYSKEDVIYYLNTIKGISYEEFIDLMIKRSIAKKDAETILNILNLEVYTIYNDIDREMISKLEDALIKIGDIKALIKVQIRYGFINNKKINGYLSTVSGIDDILEELINTTDNNELKRSLIFIYSIYSEIKVIRNTKKINNINDLLRYINVYNELPTCNLVEIISDKEIKRTRNSQI